MVRTALASCLSILALSQVGVAAADNNLRKRNFFQVEEGHANVNANPSSNNANNNNADVPTTVSRRRASAVEQAAAQEDTFGDTARHVKKSSKYAKLDDPAPASKASKASKADKQTRTIAGGNNLVKTFEIPDQPAAAADEDDESPVGASVVVGGAPLVEGTKVRTVDEEELIMAELFAFRAMSMSMSMSMP
mmetsp:Transcript_2354/g.6190  ORF Transcript_2354/g.6190 Transcript_2354/m.6190 type:complete len:192 (-) Transcript_2354:834-1409(-)|eukprot:CAMPEP_0119564536 /NCGR_PEP_ID=MMETSP1352-20130426/27285_1 /TAXON_ID=265584 /ORGANISM="Stauroneis constricta, Strain CCMP1120" /LENGTH=191 /DNA_ID=CAMNT_0007613303 /DNA_START=192 /DNA_END=767 /DNA_ORIENTATION=-